MLVVELGPALEDLLRARVDRVVVALDVGVGREVRRRERVRRGGRRVGRRERGRVAGRERRPRELGRVDLVEERVALDRREAVRAVAEAEGRLRVEELRDEGPDVGRAGPRPRVVLVDERRRLEDVLEELALAVVRERRPRVAELVG